MQQQQTAALQLSDPQAQALALAQGIWRLYRRQLAIAVLTS
jgi:hypothetical protein